jgi:Flp pilus assembly pilin Flp
MPNFPGVVIRLSRDEQGQDLIEYALLATFISLLAIAGAGVLRTALNNWQGNVAETPAIARRRSIEGRAALLTVTALLIGTKRLLW